MRALIVLSGDIRHDGSARAWLDRADRIICADGGARHLRRLGRLPNLLVGDLDSALADDVAWMTSQGVTLRQYPIAKDETDSELAVQAALDDLDHLGDRSAHEVVMLGAFGSRPDHVLANQLLAADLASQGWRLILTDGISSLYTLAGGQTLQIIQMDDQQSYPSDWVFSLIPVTQTISGLTYHDGLVWPLTDAVLRRGTTRGVSNRFIEPADLAAGSRPIIGGTETAGQRQTNKMAYQATVSLDQGVALVIVTPAD